MASPSRYFSLEPGARLTLLRLQSDDGTNRLTRARVLALTEAVVELARDAMPLVITGNTKFFSVGADLAEIAALTAPDAYEFSRTGQTLMNTIASFPAPVFAAINGYCMGGGLDLALACRRASLPRERSLGIEEPP